LHVKPNEEKGIKVTTDGVEVKDGDGIVNNATHGVTADLEAADTDKGGLMFDDVNSSPDKQIRVKANGDEGIKLTADGVAAKIKDDSGLDVDADGLFAVAGDYIVIDADGIAVDPNALFVVCA